MYLNSLSLIEICVLFIEQKLSFTGKIFALLFKVNVEVYVWLFVRVAAPKLVKRSFAPLAVHLRM